MNRRRARRNPQPSISDLPFYFAQYAFINKDAEDAIKRLRDPTLYYHEIQDKPYFNVEDFFLALENPTISPIAFAVYKNIPVKMLIDKKIRKDKIQYQLEKILKSNLKSREATNIAVKIFYISQLFPPIKPLTAEDQDFSYYGDALNHEDWADIYSEIVGSGFDDAPEILKSVYFISKISFQPTAYLDLQGSLGASDFKEKLIKLAEVIKKIAIEYGIHPTIIAIRIFTDPDFKKLATMAAERRVEKIRLEQQKMQEEETRIQKRLEEEILAEDYARELEQELMESKPDIIEPESKKYRFSEEPSESSVTSQSHRQYSVFIVGGEDFNVPAWIKNSFTIRHATGRISGERALQILGSAIPDVILVLRFVSHGTSTPITDFARKHKIPILIAKPSISSAVKQAALYGPTWFAAAYPKALKRNPYTRYFDEDLDYEIWR